jgi:hypothetical protein
MIDVVKREVGAKLGVEISAPTTLEFQIAVAPHPRTEVFESLWFAFNGQPIQPLEISGVHGNRIHKVRRGGGQPESRLRGDDRGSHRPGAGDRIRSVNVPAAQPLCRGRQVLWFRGNRVR